MKNLFLLVTLVLTIFACGTLKNLPIPDVDKVEIAVEIGCAAAAKEGCLDESDVHSYFGVLQTSDQCVSAVKSAISEKRLTVDISGLVSKVFTCKKFLKSLGL
jgi:hypothetical protein